MHNVCVATELLIYWPCTKVSLFLYVVKYVRDSNYHTLIIRNIYVL